MWPDNYFANYAHNTTSSEPFSIYTRAGLAGQQKIFRDN